MANPKYEPYVAGKALQYAVKVAKDMQLPLLLTGEPGCGKTRAAEWVHTEYSKEYDGILRFDVKTTSTARDLFYRYDAIRHYRDAQRGEVNALDYIHFNALGQAILASAQGKRYVVLIDEIDKAPRDFPNDLLFEFEHLKFRIEEAKLEELEVYKGWDKKPELAAVGAGKPNFDAQGVLAGRPDCRPFLLLTSNSEKNLPDAFMRRCAYHHIEFPGADDLLKIVEAHKLVTPAAKRLLGVFDEVRKSGLRKKPGTAELLVWLKVLTPWGDAIREKPEDPKTLGHIREAFLVLAKNREDADFLQRRFEFPPADKKP